MSQNQDVAVTVWQDHTEPDRPWIVDLIDEDGDSNTVATFASEIDATEFAQSYAALHGMQFTETD
jgi:hypothetical protein